MSGVQPFQFEPSYPPCQEPIDQEESESGDTNQRDARGRIEWCSCKKCEAMATEEECFCCQELAELNQKFDESGLFRGQKDYYRNDSIYRPPSNKRPLRMCFVNKRPYSNKRPLF